MPRPSFVAKRHKKNGFLRQLLSFSPVWFLIGSEEPSFEFRMKRNTNVRLDNNTAVYSTCISLPEGMAQWEDGLHELNI